MTTALAANKPEEQAKNKELYHMLADAIGTGDVLNIVEKCKYTNDESGYALWKAFKEYYLDDSSKDLILAHWTKLFNKL